MRNSIKKIIPNVDTLSPLSLSVHMIKIWLDWLFNYSYISNRNKLRKYHNIGIGKKAIILCNGPSLNKVDFTLFDSYKGSVDTIGLNKINLLFKKTNFRPSFIVAINKYVVEQNKEFFKTSNIPIFIDNYSKNILDSDKINYIFSLPIHGRFSKDISYGYCQGYTVTYAALQLVFFMNYDKVALVGCDHYFKDKGTPNKLVVSGKEDLNHFDKNYFSKNVSWQLPDLLGSEFHYRLAKNKFEEAGKIIYNCTDGGFLEIFDRKKIKDFLND